MPATLNPVEPRTKREIADAIDTVSAKLHEVFAQAGTDLDMAKVTVLEGDSAAKAAEIKRLNQELSGLGEKRDALAELERARDSAQKERDWLEKPQGGMVHPAGGQGPGAAAPKSLESIIRESAQYQAFQKGSQRSAVIELPYADFKTLITLTTISPQTYRQPDLVAMALEERTVADLMLEGRTDRGTVEYYEETTVTNAATTVAEGGTKPESALAWTLRTETIRKIGTWIPATDEALADVPFLESQIRGRLAFMVRRVEETQILTGNGTGTNLTGIINRSGIQTQAKGADPTPDAVYKAMQLVRGSAGSGFAEPTAAVFHPNDWTDIKLLRTADGIYIWGSPSGEGPDRIWGLPVRQTTAMTQNTGLVGAFRPFAEVIRRSGIDITVSTEHSTYFIENKVAILAEERIGLAVYRPSAFATVTGI